MENQFTTSLWGDEAFSAVLSRNSVPKILEIISRDTSPPLYNITLHYWYKLFGDSEVAIRSLSFFYYLIAILFVYKIANHLWNRKTGLVAAVFTFFNPFFFQYAFEGRMYSTLAAGVTISMCFFAKIIFPKTDSNGKIRKRANFKDYLGYIIGTSWALYSHHFAIFAVIIQGLWFIKELIWGYRKTAFDIFKSYLAIGVIYAPWLPALYYQTTLVGSGFWLQTPNLTNLRELLQKYLAEGLPNKLSRYTLYLTYAGYIVRRWGINITRSLFLASWFLGPITLTWVVSQKFQSIFFDRYLLYTIPAAMILLASNGRKLSGIILTILLPLFIYTDYQYFVNPTKRPFKDLAAYVIEVKRGDDFLINWNAAAHHIWETKYYGLEAPLYVPEGKELPFYVGTAQMTSNDIVSEIPKKAFRVGVITSGKREEVKVPGFKLSEIKEFGELKYILLTK